MQPLFMPRPALALAIALMPAAVLAQAQRSYDVAAGPLDAALRSTAAQAGVALIFTADQTAGQRSAGLRGSYTVEAAFEALLAGTAWQAVRQAGGGYALRRVEQVRQLPAGSGMELAPVIVTARAEEVGGEGPVAGYVARRSTAGSKTDTAIVEVPQTINVVTADEIAARGAISVSQALRYTPGVDSSGYTENYMQADETASRGFSPASLYLDGAYLPYAGSLGGAAQIEPYSLERIEVFKGPASVLYGQNQPGGVINLVSKRPMAEPLREVRLGVGSHGRADAALDLSGTLDAERGLLYRLVAVANGGGQQADHTRSSRLFVAPSLTWRPDARTSLTLYAQLQRDQGVWDYQAMPAVGSLFEGPDGKRISRSFFNGQPGYNDFWRNQAVLGADFAHRFNDSVLWRQKLLFTDVRDRWKGFYLRAFARDAEGVIDYGRATRTKLDWAQHNSVLSLDNHLEVKASTGPVSHTLLGGLDYRRFSRKYEGYNDYASAPIDLYAPDYGLPTAAPTLTTRWDNTVDQTGVYLQDQMRWRDLVLTVGGRHDWAGIDNKDLMEATRTRQDHKAFTGRAGVTWLVGNGVAPYLSYSESFVPIVGTDFHGRPFDSTTGKQIEAGVKYQPPGKNLLLSLAVFDIRQRNLTTTDREHPGYSVQTGEVQSRGAEMEIKASLGAAWDIAGGFSYADMRTLRSNDAEEIGKQWASTPRWRASLWVNHHLHAGLSVGAGARWSGSAFGDSANSFRTPAYLVFDAALRYDLGLIDASLRGLEGTINVQNLFDKNYVSSCNYAFGCYYGRARTVSAGVTYRW